MMIKQLIFSLAGIIFLMIPISCRYFDKTVKQEAIASFDGEELTIKSITNEIDISKMSGKDSVEFINNYINRWILKKIFMKKALLNIPKEDIEKIERMVSSYREDLMINMYKNMLVADFIDTIHIEESVRKYYDDNKEIFILGSSILKFNYIIVPKEYTGIKDLVTLLSKDSLTDNIIYEIESKCYGITKSYSLSDNSWKELNDLKKRIPLEGIKIKKKQVIQIPDKNMIWLLRVNEFVEAGSVSPFDYMSYKIKNIIRNQNKLNYIKRIEIELLESHAKNERFKKN